MKTNFGFTLVLTLGVVALICAACRREEPVPAPPVATNAAVPAKIETTNAPAVESPKPATDTAPVAVSAEDAKNHIGENAVVTGKVFGVHVTQKGDVFINIGGAFPNQPFTAVCFKQAIPTADLEKLDGQTIKVSGKIKDYNGQTEIVLEKPEQISQ